MGKVPAQRYLINGPSNDVFRELALEEEFPLTSEFFWVELEDGRHAIWLPEDDEYITDGDEVLAFLWRAMPHSHYEGTYEANANITEED